MGQSLAPSAAALVTRVAPLAANTGAGLRTSDFCVLVIEDRPADAELIRDRLAHVCGHGVVIKHALDIRRAASVFDEGIVDCIVLDLQLPDAVGGESIQAARALCPSAAIIAYSGMDNEASRLGATEAGAQHFVSKNNADPEALSRCVVDALERCRAFSRF